MCGTVEFGKTDICGKESQNGIIDYIHQLQDVVATVGKATYTQDDVIRMLGQISSMAARIQNIKQKQ